MKWWESYDAFQQWGDLGKEYLGRLSRQSKSIELSFGAKSIFVQAGRGRG